MNYPTVYARITPTNGVSGDKYSVSVTGVTATVDTQKTWSSGSLNFAITPSALGTMVVTFKNDTTGTIIGTKSIEVKSKYLLNSATFKVGNMVTDSVMHNTGYIAYAHVDPKVGIKINDDLKINNTLLNLISSYIYHVPANNELTLIMSVGNYSVFTGNMKPVITLTNLSNNLTYTSSALEPFTIGVDSDSVSWGKNITNVSDVNLIRSIMTIGSEVLMTVTYQ